MNADRLVSGSSITPLDRIDRGYGVAPASSARVTAIANTAP